MNPPNILYFVVHDLGRHLGCYGAPVASPRLDAFAGESIRFNQAYCSSAACTPSRCCAMTGQYAHVSGGVGLAHMGWPLPAGVPTIVDYLNAAGFETIHAGMEHERHPGQNRYQIDLQDSWDDFNTHVGVDKALAHLGKRCRDKPFYLNLGSQQPHPSTWSKAGSLHGPTVPEEDVYIPPFLPDLPGVRLALGRFQAAIRYMDAHFGRLLDGLRALDHDRDTIVIFTTDHGIAMPRAKSCLYDRGMETALLVRLPEGHRAGTQCDHLIQNIDLVPTLLEAAGANPQTSLPGRSFWPLLTGGHYRPHTHLFTERNFHGENRLQGRENEFIDRYDPVRAIRTPDFHLIRYFDPSVKARPWLPWEAAALGADSAKPFLGTMPPPREPRAEYELYHVRHDPEEFIDVAERPEFRKIRTDLSATLEDWMRSTDDFVLRQDVPTRRERPGWGPWEGKK